MKGSRKTHGLNIIMREVKIAFSWEYRKAAIKFSHHMKGVHIMELVLRRDMEKLFGDTAKVEQELEVLEKDHCAWNRPSEQKDLQEIFTEVKRLEFDISNLMCDCVSLKPMKQDLEVTNDLNQAFSGLNLLFEDLKTAQKDLDTSYVSKDELTQLEIDWARFQKTVRTIQENLTQMQ
jgi:hypothetical protein